jgi:hypothetical protein
MLFGVGMGVRFYVMANTAELKRKFNLDTIAVTARRTTHLHILDGAWCHLGLVISPWYLICPMRRPTQ